MGDERTLGFDVNKIIFSDLVVPVSNALVRQWRRVHARALERRIMLRLVRLDRVSRRYIAEAPSSRTWSVYEAYVARRQGAKEQASVVDSCELERLAGLAQLELPSEPEVRSERVRRVPCGDVWRLPKLPTLLSRHIAVFLSSQQAEQLRRDLETVVHYFDRLREAPVDAVEPMISPVHDRGCPLRPDGPVQHVDSAATLANAHGRRGNFFAVSQARKKLEDAIGAPLEEQSTK